MNNVLQIIQVVKQQRWCPIYQCIINHQRLITFIIKLCISYINKAITSDYGELHSVRTCSVYLHREHCGPLLEELMLCKVDGEPLRRRMRNYCQPAGACIRDCHHSLGYIQLQHVIILGLSVPVVV